MIERKVLIPIVISCFSLAISFMTFYLSHLRSAHIQIDSGEYIDIYYFTDGPLGITLPISIVNHGAQLATIRKLALLIQSPGSSEGYLLEPRWYQRIDQDGNFLYDSLPVPIAVASRQNVTKQVLFRSSLDRPKEFQLTKPGVYNMTVLGWITDSVNPQVADSFSIIVSDADAELLVKRIQEPGRTLRIRQSQWRKWSAHYLTEIEVKTVMRGD